MSLLVNVIICPGIHDPALTEDFLTAIQAQLEACCQRDRFQFWVFPAQTHPAYSGLEILQFMNEKLRNESLGFSQPIPVLFIGFSAGVVGAIGAAWKWRHLHRPVKALIALDGWGAALWGDFPIHRISHDYFTHWSSALLGAGEDSFYADPGVSHLQLWRSPHTTNGWWVFPSAAQTPVQTTTASFLTALLQRYGSTD